MPVFLNVMILFPPHVSGLLTGTVFPQVYVLNVLFFFNPCPYSEYTFGFSMLTSISEPKLKSKKNTQRITHT